MSDEKKKYADTLNLPRTDFPQRANLPKREPQLQARWEELDLYRRLRELRQGQPKYVLHDGPPYANGHVHIGTGITKLDKDIVNRFKAMRGFDIPFIPGWDCHGLPIEIKVLRELGDAASSMSKAEIRTRCRDYAMRFVDLQREQFRRLGCIGDWENPYLTLTRQYEAAIIATFEDLVERGYVFRRRKPIHWCMSCETALAEAELEYKDDTPSDSIYVRFPFVSELKKGFGNLEREPVDPTLLIWTTTPWTLPANVATALHPDLEYALFEYEKPGDTTRLYTVFCAQLAEKLFPLFGVERYHELARADGRQLEGLQYRHPLFEERTCPIILADYVSPKDGTGCVHTAPGHGTEDYVSGLEHELPVFSPVDEQGRFTQEAGEFQGKTVFEANPLINHVLHDRGLMVLAEKFTHSYPHCWRCKSPVIFRATEQWFLDVDHRHARRLALEEIRKVRWVPRWGEARISSMVETRPDWCISRQRTWGVPVPAFYCNKCSEVLLTKPSVAAVRELFAREGATAWFTTEPDQVLPPGLCCSKCGERDFRREEDILDVWFESGASHRAVVVEHPELHFPADLYIEGTDQHRGWFQVSLLLSVMTREQAPFRTVVTNGFVVDEEGEKLSKSQGVLSPVDEVCDRYGADVVRLWFASIDFTDDIPFSFRMLKERGETYRKLRNTFRFLLGNLRGYEPRRDEVPPEQLRELDRHARAKLHRLLVDVSENLENFEFHRAFNKLHQYCVVDLSAFYLDVLKDRLYTLAENDPLRRAAQTVLFEITSCLARALAPILVHTADEVWAHLPGSGRPDSIHLADWPRSDQSALDPALEERWEKLLRIRSDVEQVLETLRKEKKIGSSLEARLQLYAEEAEVLDLLKTPQLELAELFIVSEVELLPVTKEQPAPETATPGKAFKKLWLAAEPSPHPRCARCWRRVDSIGSASDYPEVCGRCAQVLHSLSAQ